MQNNAKLATLGIVGVIVSVAVLAVNPFQPQNFWPTPEAVVSPVINYVRVGLYNGRSSVDVSYEANRAEMGVSWNSQVGTNNCLYWTGYHWPDEGYDTEHTDVGYNSYSHFMWHNWGSDYDDFEIEVERLANRSGFASGGPEDVTITSSGGDYWALVRPSYGVLHPTRCPALPRRLAAHPTGCQCITTLTCC